ncbi:MAG: thiol peroxidase [Phycisphaerae bacterium]|nr:thiol peroxidase [Phycisphaerae bacterium]
MSRTVTLKGNPLNLEGPQLKAGDKAPDATLKKSLVDKVKVSETQGKTRIFSVVPSLDTPVCATQTKRFNEEAAKMSNIAFYTISCDLPTAQARFCGAEGIDREKLHVLSDHQDTSFGKAYGTLVPDLRVNCRAAFVVDAGGTIRYAEYVPEIAEQPNYDAILKAAREAAEA